VKKAAQYQMKREDRGIVQAQISPFFLQHQEEHRNLDTYRPAFILFCKGQSIGISDGFKSDTFKKYVKKVVEEGAFNTCPKLKAHLQTLLEKTSR